MEEHGDDPIDPALLDRTQTSPFLLGNATGVVHDQIVPVGFGRFLNAPLEGGIEGVRDVGDDARDRVGLAGAEAARSPVGYVPEFVYGIKNPLPGLSGD